jgi:hypothetical protein
VRGRCCAATSCGTTLEANDLREESSVVEQIDHSRIDGGQEVPSILSLLRTAAYLRARGQCGSLLMCFDIIASVSNPVSTGEVPQVVPSLRVSAGAIMLIAVVWAVCLPLLSRLWFWSGPLETRPKIEVQVWVSLGCA